MPQIKLSPQDSFLAHEMNWYRNKAGYMWNDKNGYMHRIIMNPPKGMVVDHINGNKLDNRRENLRVVTQHANSTNRKDSLGVHKARGRSKWSAYIKVFYKRIHLGQFDTREEALVARKEAEEKYWAPLFEVEA